MFFGPLVYVSGYLVLLFLAICMVVHLLRAASICAAALSSASIVRARLVA